jgi:hypothetical protein
MVVTTATDCRYGVVDGVNIKPVVYLFDNVVKMWNDKNYYDYDQTKWNILTFQ